MNNKIGFIAHPIVAIVIAFILGVIITVIVAKGFIPTGNFKIC
jgi:tetrahydromethanopterin S-methyltransferase subunit C|tara:strand:+ start:279 stop:407 length:129 start_codon:yes stop_codon:yes gene_type:complete